MPYVRVVFPLAHPEPLIYLVDGDVPPGVRVRAPLKNREVVGFVVGREKTEPSFQCKRAEPIDAEPLIGERLIRLLMWVSDYYLEPPGMVWAAALPPYVRDGRPVPRPVGVRVRLREGRCEGLTARQRELVALLERLGGEAKISEIERVWGISRSVVYALEKKGVIELVEGRVAESFDSLGERVVLTDEQKGVIEEVEKGWGRFSRFLLHGVTGSGKTQVYKILAQKAVDEGRGVLILVPEISLTPHYVKRFQDVFGDTLAVLHSGLSDSERARQWLGVREGRLKVVIGTRSAVFAPVENCGLVVVDEEHDASFKQQESPRYNARDVAVVRARIEGCPVLLGSATPSVESYTNAISGKYTLLVMKKRVGRGRLPSVRIVDMRGKRGIISDELREALEGVLARREGAMVLVNRRGYFRVCVCDSCGASVKCPNCDVSLTPHRQREGFVLVCHWCGYREDGKEICSECGAESIRMVGFGVERVQDELKRLFPEAKIERMDRETVQSRYKRWSILERMAAGEIDILVGTQMIAKGHHFPQVTLSAIVGADLGLNIPDFRSAERTFQLICQMAGRAGRGDKPGMVLVQCFDPDHYAIRCAATCNYEAFYEQEISLRREFGYPPFSRLVRLIFVGANRDRVREVAEGIGEELRGRGAGVEVLGPAPSGIEKLKNRYRWHLLLKGRDRKGLLSLAASVPHAVGSVRILRDVDPYEFL